MADAIVLLIVMIIIIFAIKSSIRHFKGEGACCGGGSKRLPKEKDKVLSNPVIGEKILRIEGMHCERCRQSVEAAVNKIAGAAAKADLKKNQAVVSFDRPIDDDVLKKAVEDAGFKVTSIL